MATVINTTYAFNAATAPAEPSWSAKMPPVVNVVVTVSDITDVGYGMYLIYQDKITGGFWNRTTQTFGAYSPSTWANCAWDLYYRGGLLFGVFIGADEMPAAANVIALIYSTTDVVGALAGSPVKSRDTDIYRTSLFRDEPWPAAAPGTVPINQDTGGTNNLRAVDPANNGLVDVQIVAYLTSDYNANPLTAPQQGKTTTDDNGSWRREIRLLAVTNYTLIYFDAGYSMGRKDITTRARNV